MTNKIIRKLSKKRGNLFRLNIKGNMIRTLYSRSGKSFSQIEAYRIGPIPLLKKIDC
jgi:hypothetical protein